MTKKALIVGAGPAGLTAAFELQQRSNVKPVVIEADVQVGGISRTVIYRGNRMDIGGHRFFSKSDWVMQWWQKMLPVAGQNGPTVLNYQGQQSAFTPQIPAQPGEEAVMLVRSRLSRIFYRRRFFDYPLKLNWTTLKNLGAWYAAAVGMSYAKARFQQRVPEVSLEDFLVNRFGDKLYRTFFKDYTEKVWGVPCADISAEWGAQRIKGLSIGKALKHALLKPFSRSGDTRQKATETSLIERFLYPRLGPGQMWEETARRITLQGGEIHLRSKVVAIHHDGYRINAVEVRDANGEVRRVAGDYLISTMPIKDLVMLLQPEDRHIAHLASLLPYRDFITVGLLVRRMRCRGTGVAVNGMPPDNWIYIQEPDVKLGRLQIFNNWSPALVEDPDKIWLGLEYFCAEGDALWSMPDDQFLRFASEELAKIGLIEPADVLDGTVIRVPKAYPAYFGEYRHIGKIRAFLDQFENLFPVGRNGMHRYNNQDHSMLAAKQAVDCITGLVTDKTTLWSINAEEDYHEEKSA